MSIRYVGKCVDRVTRSCTHKNTDRWMHDSKRTKELMNAEVIFDCIAIAITVGIVVWFLGQYFKL